MILKSVSDPEKIIQITLPPKSLYILQNELRYDFTHEINKETGKRRLSIIKRIAPETNAESIFNFGKL